MIQASDVRFVEAEIMGERRVGNEEELEILKSCIPDNMPLEDDEAVPIDDVVIPTDTSNRIVHVEEQAAIAPGGRISPKDPSLLPEEGHRKAVTRTESDLRPENPQAPVLRRSGRHGRQAQANRAMLESGASDEAENDPLSYREALEQSRYADWKKAMGAEFYSLIENKTWTYCSTVPNGTHPIGCKWVYILKTNPDGSRRFKARLVIRGYEQTDIGETFAPVAKLVSLRMILALSASKGWEVDHMDVVTAFLNPPVNDEIYMSLPEGIDWLDPNKPASATACRLNKALYGLKEAPRLWYRHIDEFLLSAGFRKSINDPNLYQSVDGELLLILYVDDLLLAAKHRRRIDQAKSLLHSRYRMNDLGPARQFLGLEIDHLPNGNLKLHQTRFITRVLRRFEMEDCNGVQTPMEPGRRLEPAKEGDKLIEPREYQSLVGSLMYIAVGTRPDLDFAIATMSKFNAKPTTNHFSRHETTSSILKAD